MQQCIQINNKLGLHARAAAKLVELAKSFSSDIKIVKNHREVDAKSIMSVLMLAATKGTTLTLCVNGKDQTQALAAIVQLIENKFDEGE